MRIGLVGAGAIARDHMVALREVRGARVVAVADVALPRAQELAATVAAEAAAHRASREDWVVLRPPPTRAGRGRVGAVPLVDRAVGVSWLAPLLLRRGDPGRGGGA